MNKPPCEIPGSFLATILWALFPRTLTKIVDAEVSRSHTRYCGRCGHPEHMHEEEDDNSYCMGCLVVGGSCTCHGFKS